MSAINFSRWITRLGLKREAEPGISPIVQPVILMADQRGLVSPVRRHEYLVGGANVTVGANHLFLAYAPVPLWFKSFRFGNQNGGAMRLLAATVAPPQTSFTLGNTVCSKQILAGDQAELQGNFVYGGEPASLPPTEVPSFTSNIGAPSRFDDFIVPAGGHLIAWNFSSGGITHYAAHVVEMPGDKDQ